MISNTKQIYALGNLISTIETEGNVVSPYYNYTDHLNSINTTSDASGALVYNLDYYPYGQERVNTGIQTSRKYIGERYDSETGLNYLNARYYDGKRGQFISQDPEFYLTSPTWLIDPQNQNSYAYASNNPVNLSDPSGRSAIGNAIQGIKKLWGRVMGTQEKGNSANNNTQTKSNTVLNSPVGDAPVTSLFMSNRSNCSICSKIHGGTDYKVPVGTPVYATARGKVLESREMNGYGNTVILNHGSSVQEKKDNVYTLYAHGSSLEVKQGQNVNTNDLIMYSGNTGNSTSPHLHYEVISSPTYPTNFFKNLNIRYSPSELSKLLIKQ